LASEAALERFARAGANEAPDLAVLGAAAPRVWAGRFAPAVAEAATPRAELGRVTDSARERGV
jgi:hypothetical protein